MAATGLCGYTALGGTSFTSASFRNPGGSGACLWLPLPPPPLPLARTCDESLPQLFQPVFLCQCVFLPPSSTFCSSSSCLRCCRRRRRRRRGLLSLFTRTCGLRQFCLLLTSFHRNYVNISLCGEQLTVRAVFHYALNFLIVPVLLHLGPCAFFYPPPVLS